MVDRIEEPLAEHLFPFAVLRAPLLAQGDYTGALAQLRRFKQREMLRIAVRDLARLAGVVEITREISDAADIISGGKGTAAEKKAALRECGITVADSPADIGATVARLLARA